MYVVLHALGTGTCHGLDGRTPPLFHVCWGKKQEQQLFFELSPDFRTRVRQHARIDPALMSRVHIAVSHVHEDHFGGAMSFKLARHCARAAAKRADAGSVMIYGPHQLSTAMEHLHAAHLPERKDQKLELAGITFEHPIDGEPTPIADAVLRQHHLFHAHPEVEAVGFRLELPGGAVIAYTGDVAWPHDPKSHSLKIADGILMVAEGAAVLICDAGGRIGHLSKRHFTPAEAGALAARAHVQHLALTHYTGLDTHKAMVADVRSAGYQGKVSILSDNTKLMVNSRR